MSRQKGKSDIKKEKKIRTEFLFFREKSCFLFILLQIDSFEISRLNYFNCHFYHKSSKKLFKKKKRKETSSAHTKTYSLERGKPNECSFCFLLLFF